LLPAVSLAGLDIRDTEDPGWTYFSRARAMIIQQLMAPSRKARNLELPPCSPAYARHAGFDWETMRLACQIWIALTSPHRIT